LAFIRTIYLPPNAYERQTLRQAVVGLWSILRGRAGKKSNRCNDRIN